LHFQDSIRYRLIQANGSIVPDDLFNAAPSDLAKIAGDFSGQASISSALVAAIQAPGRSCVRKGSRHLIGKVFSVAMTQTLRYANGV
jgi:hypothetical protein